MPGDLRVGEDTPRGTPSRSVSGYSQSGSPRRCARLEIRFKKKGCPSAISMWSFPFWHSWESRSRIFESNVYGKGCALLPCSIESVKPCIQGAQRAAKSLAKEGHWDLGRCGGGVLCHEGLPPPSLLDPNRVILEAHSL